MNNPTRSAQSLRTLYLAFLSFMLAACGEINIGIEPTPGPATATAEIPPVEPTPGTATPTVELAPLQDYPLYAGPVVELFPDEAPPGLDPRLYTEGVTEAGGVDALWAFEGTFSGEVELQLPEMAYEIYLERDLATAQQTMASYNADRLDAEYSEDGSWIGEDLGFRFHEARLFYSSREADGLLRAVFAFRSRNAVGILQLGTRMDKFAEMQPDEPRRILFEALRFYLAPLTRALGSAATADPSMTALPAVVLPQPAATPMDSRFTAPSFALSPDSPQGQSVFPPGSDLVYARWSYKRMMQDTIVLAKVSRTYRWDEDTDRAETWSLPEQAWDLARYGSEGDLTDFEIRSLGTELGHGYYSVELYVDGIMEAVGFFEVAQAEEAVSVPILSPDGTRTAIVMKGGTLVIQEEGTEDRQILATDEISGLAWFPDGNHIVFSDRDRSLQVPGTTLARKDELWIIDVLTGETTQLATLEENLHDPVVSPEGHYIALIEGNRAGDAGSVYYDLRILEVDAQFQRVASFSLADFPDLASFESQSDSWLSWNQPDLTPPGIWEQEGMLRSPLIWGTADPPALGIFRLDLKGMRAEKIGELTEE